MMRHLRSAGAVLGVLGLTLLASLAIPLPSRAVPVGGLTNVVSCESYAKYDASSTGDTQIIPLSATLTIRICGYAIHLGGTATTIGLDYGTGANCVTGTTALTPYWQITANNGRVIPPGFWAGLAPPVGNAVCVHASAANAAQVEIWYTRY